MIEVTDLSYSVPNKPHILDSITFQLPSGSFFVVVGENGAGKTTLLDILMGFRRRTSGAVSVLDADPQTDPWQARARIAYLSEKVDMPGDWETREYLEFHRRFYSSYDLADETNLLRVFGLASTGRIGNLSAGEIRRVQIVAALATQPQVLIADEITAVLDIQGRKRFLDLLKERQRMKRLTVVLATNVPEGLDSYADYVLLIRKGSQVAFAPLGEFLEDETELARAVLHRLEE